MHVMVVLSYVYNQGENTYDFSWERNRLLVDVKDRKSQCPVAWNLMVLEMGIFRMNFEKKYDK